MYGSSQNAGLQFDYVHDEDSNFQLVGMVKPQKSQRMFRRNPVPFRKLMQKDIERREMQYYNQSNKMKRSIAKEQVSRIWRCRKSLLGSGHFSQTVSLATTYLALLYSTYINLLLLRSAY